MTEKLSLLENKNVHLEPIKQSKTSRNFSDIKSIKEGESELKTSTEKNISGITQKVPSLNLDKVQTL